MTKKDRLQKLANENGVISAMAIDQRGSLAKMLTKELNRDASREDVEEFKKICVEVLTPYASAVLLDPEYGLPALSVKAPNSGVLLAYEKTGYDAIVKGRLPDLLPGYSVARLRDEGADGVKLLVYYDPFDSDEINDVKRDFIRKVGDECKQEEMPFFLEIISYSDEIGDEKSIVFAEQKPKMVKAYMGEFSDPVYGVDVFKVEIPVNMRYVEGSTACVDGEAVYSREDAKSFIQEAAAVCTLPFIFLSAGVSIEVFLESLSLVRDSGVKYSGVLCGRATWQNGVAEYGKGGAEGLRAWLLDEGVKNIQAVNDELSLGAQSVFVSY